MNKSVNICLGEPVVISQAPAEVRDWGPWQFPMVTRSEDNHIQVTFHLGADSAKDYGKQKGQAISKDGGKTWSRLMNIDEPGFPLPNGDRIKPYICQSIPVGDIVLPEKSVGSLRGYAVDFVCYAAEDIKDDIATSYFLRKEKGRQEWIKEKTDIAIPGNVLYHVEGVVPGVFFWRMRVSPEGDIWAMTYRWRIIDGVLQKYLRAMFMVSSDGGHRWRYSEIPYRPIPAADEQYEKRGGFGEPDVTFLPDGSTFCLLRTTDGHGIGPMYCSKSMDRGVTWSKPEIFDRLGVWPDLLTLGNGITLASYGRMGLFLRATSDAAALCWDDPVEVVKPLEYQTDTCSYSGMVALDDSSALIIYSDFNYPDGQGVPRKSIMARKISVHI